jgi:hypothetical protein
MAAANSGRALYANAVQQNPPNRLTLEDALAAFDGQCAAGDDWSLEARAYVLAALGRDLDAALSLDAFLLRHPLASLSADVKARVESNLSLIFGKVATLEISTNAYRVDFQLDGSAVVPLRAKVVRTTPGSHVVRLAAPGFYSQQRAVNVIAGQTFAVKIQLESALAMSRPLRSESAADLTDSSTRKTSAWPIVFSVGAGVALATGVVGTVMAFDAASSYQERGCSVNSSPQHCDGIKARFQLSNAMEVGGFVAAGAFATAAITALLLSSDTDREHIKSSAQGCSIGIASISCHGQL